MNKYDIIIEENKQLKYELEYLEELIEETRKWISKNDNDCIGNKDWVDLKEILK